MKIQGLGNIDSAYMNGSLAMDHDPVQMPKAQPQKSPDVELIGIKSVINEEKNTGNSQEEIQQQRERVQDLIQKQKKSFRLIKNLLYLITPGMHHLMEKDLSDKNKSHIQTFA